MWKRSLEFTIFHVLLFFLGIGLDYILQIPLRGAGTICKDWLMECDQKWYISLSGLANNDPSPLPIILNPLSLSPFVR